MIVISLISFLFKDKIQEDKKPKPKMPPFSNQTAPPKPMEARTATERPKTLGDFATEIFEQLNDKKPEVFQTQPPLVVIPEPARVKVETQPEVVRETRERMTQRGIRPQLTERPLVKKLRGKSAFQVEPTSQKDLMQAIIMTEVLGKPKAKR